MRVVIAGGHGKVALRLTRRVSARGDSVVGLIGNPEHADVIAHGRRILYVNAGEDEVEEALRAVLGEPVGDEAG